MRKRIIGKESLVAEGDWLDLEQVAEVEITSEDLAHPIENALMLDRSPGWRAGASGPQTIRIIFAEPRVLRRIYLHFIEDQLERQQELVLAWSFEEGKPMREIVRQQYHFSPGGAVQEVEDFKVELEAVRLLELKIIPDRSGGPALATLARMRVG